MKCKDTNCQKLHYSEGDAKKAIDAGVAARRDRGDEKPDRSRSPSVNNSAPKKKE